jgi:hypothetical protein
MTVYVIIKTPNEDDRDVITYPSGYSAYYEAEMKVIALNEADPDGLYSYSIDEIEFDGACCKCKPQQIKCDAV